uniref:LRAT domain-containing protein n=1 Tax=Catharus ustulatus TaxID=91951 RepID=A0A8C3VAA8_CATUS
MVFIVRTPNRDFTYGSSRTGAGLPLHSPRLPAALCPALSRPSYSCTSSLHAPEMGQDKSKPQPGDLIEIDRPFHQHWALYIGDGYVINLTPVDKPKIMLGTYNLPVFTSTVKRQLLEEVVGNHKWHVNNKSDEYQTPLPVKQIIQRAAAYVGKEVTYCLFGRSSEYFVTELRYGEAVSEQLRTFIGGELHILGMSDFEYTPNLGDMIEIKREHDDHWALYVGDGYVIHGTPVAGSEKIVIKKITKELLKEVVGNDSWAVNNKYDQYCCPLPVQVIIRRAERCIDGELPYYVIDFKADGFVTKLRYGGQLRAFICGELHILGMSDFEYTPNLGDMIEIKREHDDHWALYVGDGYVIHGTPVAGSETIVIKKITKELLKEVVGTDSWAVNNKYDQYCCPLPVQVIIRRAERCIDGELPYYVIDFKADGFVTKLRYGGQLWCTVGSELLIPDMSHDKFKPNPGDMIEIKRTGYQHWALYMGRGYVIHMTPVDETIPSYSASNETTVILRIKKALLTVVARNDSWAVNNKYDQYRSPLPVEEIIKRAEGCIGKEMAYHVFDFKADDFVRKLRYGGQLMTFVGIELCIPDTIYDQIYPNPGDMVEIKQPGHHHWALYMGDGYVIHVTAVGENSLRVSTGSGTVHIRKLKVKKQLLADVARYETCCVNNKYDHYLTPCPVKEIIQRAEYWIGREWPYDVFSKHSEHFVTELRYGEAVSKQVENAVIGGFAATAGVGLLGAVAGIAMAFQKQ